MTSRSKNPLDVFVRATHRRLIALRFAESTGIGLLVGCAASTMLVGIQLWRNMPALPIAIVMMAIGALCGMLWALRRWPTRVEAAREADRQLDLEDLLATAVMVRDQERSDPWVRTVIALADQRCRTLSPSALILNRLGARAWGGIGVAVALVLALGLLGSDPRPSSARQVFANPEDERNATQAPSRTIPSEAAPQRETEGRVSRRAEALPNGETRGSAGASPSQGHIAGDGAGIGSTSNDRESSNAINWAGGEQSPDRSGMPAAAGGASRSASDGQGGSAGLGAGSSDPDPAPAPWQSNAWPEDRQRALSEIDAGRVPDAYRDVVREYFNR